MLGYIETIFLSESIPPSKCRILTLHPERARDSYSLRHAFPAPPLSELAVSYTHLTLPTILLV